jgi:hypothetical protein
MHALSRAIDLINAACAGLARVRHLDVHTVETSLQDRALEQVDILLVKGRAG